MDPKSMEKAMLKNMIEKTGKPIKEWISIVNKHNIIIERNWICDASLLFSANTIAISYFIEPKTEIIADIANIEPKTPKSSGEKILVNSGVLAIEIIWANAVPPIRMKKFFIIKFI